jgi:hypothetical protein
MCWCSTGRLVASAAVVVAQGAVRLGNGKTLRSDQRLHANTGRLCAVKNTQLGRTRHDVHLCRV